MMGRWRSGAPLALCPLHDDPGARRRPATQQRLPVRGRRLRRLQDARRLAHPAHATRATRPSPAWSRLHRMIRRGTAYGPPLPEGVLEDDGADRGLMFAFVGAHLGRQFEFVQSEWINDGDFFGLGDAKDPIVGAERRGRRLLRSRGGRCAGGCRACRGSSSPAAASTASCPACARCAGSPTCDP